MPFRFNPLTSSLDLVNDTPPSSTAFSTISVPNGTNPVADVAADVLSLASSDNNVIITGSAGSDSVDLAIASAITSNLSKSERFILSAGDITAKQVSLSASPLTPSKTQLEVVGGGPQSSSDFSVTGAVVSWNGTFLDGVLVAGDEIIIDYN
jgi:hypothetical protein